jgi:hypothetical protein
VPLTAVSTQTIFDIPLGGVNLTGATITMKACTESGNGGGVQIGVNNGATLPDGGTGYESYQDTTQTNLTGTGGLTACSTGTMKTITLTLTAGSTGTLDPTAVDKISIYVYAGGTAATWSNPTIVYIDSVTIAGAATTSADHVYDFNVAADVAASSTTYPTTGVIGVNIYSTPITGSTVAQLTD